MIKKYKQLFKKVKENKFFQGGVIAVILVSSLSIGAKTYEIGSFTHKLIFMIDNVITVFFLIELLIRVFAEKTWYRFFHYKNGWNWFDFLIVLFSLMPLEFGSYLLLGRLLRLFRVLRLITIIPRLRVLTEALITAIPRMGYVALMMFIIFYIYAVFGSFLFEKINRELWGDLGSSMLTLFRISTFEDWTDIMYETIKVYPLSWIYYISFIFLSAFVFLNMMIGIVVNILEEEHSKDEKKDRKVHEEKLEEEIRNLNKQVQYLRIKIDKHFG